jgi:hypothetical protein
VWKKTPREKEMLENFETSNVEEIIVGGVFIARGRGSS